MPQSQLEVLPDNVSKCARLPTSRGGGGQELNTYRFKLQDGDTPLMKSAKNGHLEVVKKLLGAGADANAANSVSM
jgi:hypothetical protein